MNRWFSPTQRGCILTNRALLVSRNDWNTKTILRYIKWVQHNDGWDNFRQYFRNCLCLLNMKSLAAVYRYYRYSSKDHYGSNSRASSLWSTSMCSFPITYFAVLTVMMFVYVILSHRAYFTHWLLSDVVVISKGTLRITFMRIILQFSGKCYRITWW